MNDFDLEAKLKSVPLPERSEDYWENFPAQVRVNLRRAATRPMAENLWRPRLAWAGGLALVLALGVFCVKTSSAVISKHEKHLHMELVRFQTKLHAFMLDEHGMHYLIAEKE